ncbi:MAG: DUF547 domain-containing protein [Maribacter sp.]|nr:DUF547 domain-containing protein [Maribacter sp.]
MFKRSAVGLICLLTVFIVKGQEKEEYFAQADVFFSTYVKDGRVDYKAIGKNTNSLNNVLDLVKEIRISKEDPTEYQAFWINGYNLLVIKGVVENYPIKSPLDIAGFFDVTKHEIGGEHISLNDIEHKMLRAEFPREPRFHFVLVCAGLGCPPIINKAYMPLTLDDQLERQTQSALNDPDFIKVVKNKVRISQIFEWYKKDFTKGGQRLVDYINTYRTEKLPAKAKVSYYKYNWTLNEIH